VRGKKILSDFSHFSLERVILKQWNTLCLRMAIAPRVELVKTPNQTLIVTDTKEPLLNRVIRTEIPEKDIDGAITKTIDFFKSRDVSFCWQVQPDDTPRDLSERLKNRGFIIDETPGMAIDLRKLRIPEAIPGFTVEIVKTPEMVENFSRALSHGSELTPETSHLFHAIHSSIGVVDDYRHYIGYYNGTPVSTSSVQYADGVAGLYMVSTLPESRKQGFGSLITSAPLIDARDRGYRIGILHSSKMGYNLYLRLGFKKYCTMTGYIFEK
jgi:GNAT superfamily N-acetyltransferase